MYFVSYIEFKIGQDEAGAYILCISLFLYLNVDYTPLEKNIC